MVPVLPLVLAALQGGAQPFPILNAGFDGTTGGNVEFGMAFRGEDSHCHGAMVFCASPTPAVFASVEPGTRGMEFKVGPGVHGVVVALALQPGMVVRWGGEGVAWGADLRVLFMGLNLKAGLWGGDSTRVGSLGFAFGL